MPLHVTQLVQEAQHCLEAFKQCNSLSEVNSDSINSINSRLQQKKRSLGKQAGRVAGIDEALAAVNSIRIKVLMIAETCKILETVEKKLNRVNCKKLEDSFAIAIPCVGGRA